MFHLDSSIEQSTIENPSNSLPIPNPELESAAKIKWLVDSSWILVLGHEIQIGGDAKAPDNELAKEKQHKQF